MHEKLLSIIWKGKKMGKFDIENMDLYYGDFHAIKNVKLQRLSDLQVVENLQCLNL